MTSIGGQSVLIMRGHPQPAAEAYEILPLRLGEDYQRLRAVGRRGRDSMINTLDTAADTDAAETIAAAYDAMLGSLVSIVDGFGITHTNCRVMGVRTFYRAVFTPSGDTIQVSAMWSVRREEPLA